MKTIVVVALALAALAGCESLEIRSPLVVKPSPLVTQKAVSVAPTSAQEIKSTSASAASVSGSASRSAKKPNEYASLQPFKKFKKGEGEGYAIEYKSRTKAQFVALLRDKKLAKKEMRVSCEVLVRQMVEAHPELPFEGCEGAASAIERDNDFAVVPCKDSMFLKDSWLTVTNAKGSSFGVWHRTCLAGEKVLTYKGETLASTLCMNGAVSVQKIAPVPAAPFSVAQSPVRKPLMPTPTAVCPKGIVLFANAWTMDSIYAASNDLGKRVDALIAVATKRDSENASNVKAYAANDVSGGNIGDGVSENIGDEIIRVVNVRAPLGIDIRVNLLDPVTTKVVVEDLGNVPLVDGIAKIYLTEAQRAYIVETVWPAWFSSPTVSGGERRIWVLPDAWNKKGGKGFKWCTLQKNAAYWKASKP